MAAVESSASRTLTSVGIVAGRPVVTRSMKAGLWIWPCFTLLDAYMCYVAYPGAPFGLFVAYRVVTELAFFAIYRASLDERVGLDVLLRAQRSMYVATAVVIALMAVYLGGIRSPYMHGISIVALVWAALVHSHWLTTLPTMLGIGLAFPVVMTGIAIVSPEARSDWTRSDSLIVFASNYVFVLATTVLSLILSHMVWSAQQRVRTLGSYRLEERLGQGGMGEVWSATHRLLARRSAIKLIRQEALGGDEQARRQILARFEREAQATASLRSPHTIQVYDFGVSTQGAFYYVMELLDGVDGAGLIDQYGAVHAERAVHFLLQACESLGEAHEAGLVHRDIKPSNLFICRYGREVDFVKVLDFGLVKPTAPISKDLTGERTIGGTPAYMSPEQILGTGRIDERSDIYALGCVAFWLLTGRQVFEGETAMAIMMAHAGDQPMPPSRCTELPIPVELDELTLRCLAKQPQDRPQSADALAEALRRIPLASTWDRDCARKWWDVHRPAAARRADETLPIRRTPPITPSA